MMMMITVVEEEVSEQKASSVVEAMFVTVVRLGTGEDLKHLISSIPNLDFDTGQGYTPLMEAVDTENVDTFDYLLNNGACVTKENNRGCVALHYAAAQGNLHMVKALLEKGHEYISIILVINMKKLLLLLKDKINDMGLTPLMYSCCKDTPEVTELLIKNGADIHTLSVDGSTALHYAAELGIYNIAVLLAEMGAQKNIKNKAGLTPLDLSSRHPGLKEALEGITLPLPLYKLCLKFAKANMPLFPSYKEILPVDCIEELDKTISFYTYIA